MAKSLPNTHTKLKLVSVPLKAGLIASRPELTTVGKFWVIKFITVGLDAALVVVMEVSVRFAGVIVWQYDLPVGQVAPVHFDFGEGLSTGVEGENFEVRGAAFNTNFSISYGYF